jgi:hypothetical protein
MPACGRARHFSRTSWLLSTSIFSERADGVSMQPCQAQMPSVRLKIAVVGTGGVSDSDRTGRRPPGRRGGRSPSHRRARHWSPSTDEAGIAYTCRRSGNPALAQGKSVRAIESSGDENAKLWNRHNPHHHVFGVCKCRSAILPEAGRRLPLRESVYGGCQQVRSDHRDATRP